MAPGGGDCRGGVVIYGVAQMLPGTDAIIRAKVPSYRGVADAGLWIRAHAPPGTAVLSSSIPQNTYYAERPTYNFPGEEKDLPGVLLERKPGYLVVSAWEQSPAWVYDWPQRNPDKVSVAAVFHADAARKQLSAVVYAVKTAAGRAP